MISILSSVDPLLGTYVCRITTPITKVFGSPASLSLIVFALRLPLQFHCGFNMRPHNSKGQWLYSTSSCDNWSGTGFPEPTMVASVCPRPKLSAYEVGTSNFISWPSLAPVPTQTGLTTRANSPTSPSNATHWHLFWHSMMHHDVFVTLLSWLATQIVKPQQTCPPLLEKVMEFHIKNPGAPHHIHTLTSGLTPFHSISFSFISSQRIYLAN